MPSLSPTWLAGTQVVESRAAVYLQEAGLEAELGLELTHCERGAGVLVASQPNTNLFGIAGYTKTMETCTKQMRCSVIGPKLDLTGPPLKSGTWPSP